MDKELLSDIWESLNAALVDNRGGRHKKVTSHIETAMAKIQDALSREDEEE